MNTSNSTVNTTDNIITIDVVTLVGIVLTFLTNIFQLYKHGHLSMGECKSSCCTGDGLFMFSRSPEASPKQSPRKKNKAHKVLEIDLKETDGI